MDDANLDGFQLDLHLRASVRMYSVLWDKVSRVKDTYFPGVVLLSFMPWLLVSGAFF
jgi:hypothetical protein